MRQTLAIALVCLVLASAAAAQDAGAGDGQPLQAPRLSHVVPDWDAARTQAAIVTGSDEAPLDRLNQSVSTLFPAIRQSAVPVLLPLDVRKILQQRAEEGGPPAGTPLSGFQPTGFFLAGRAGYDAAFSVRTAETDGLRDIRFRDPVVVEISASAFHYELPAVSGLSELSPQKRAGPFGPVRRFILEHYIRHSFEAFGVTYVVSISCFEGRPRARWISCRLADRIAEKFIETLSLAGGTPPQDPAPAQPFVRDRPQAVSAVFTYHAPGDLLPNTGFKKLGGVPDRTVYLNMSFPFADAPAYVNSQSFMNWGDCDQTGRVPHPRGRKDTAYRCRVNNVPLVFNEGAEANYSYPWRDNFCEHRHFAVGQCPGGRGHQGVDIRPAVCERRNEGADRCLPYRDELVAVREGMILRTAGQESVYLTVNAPSERVRLRYLHMHPDQLDAAGIVSGRVLREGEPVGRAGNFNRRENLTTYHLHFEMFVPTRDGWVRVNPYMSLVAAYERLIRARGREVSDPEPAAEPQSPVQAKPATPPRTRARGKRRHR